jgi:selenide,water dikinase
VTIDLWINRIPFIDGAVHFAGMGMFPEGSAANKKFCRSLVVLPEKADPVLLDLVFDAQTSGGLVLSVPEAQMAQARDMLLEAGDLAAHIGQVLSVDTGRARLNIV